MLYIRKSEHRGYADHGWLKSFHTFSFADYYDPNFMAYSTLRVINEDKIDGGMGFDTHPHKDMEIITYVVKGSLQHRDSMGNETVILPDEVQVMSAGTGVKHSEYNHSKDGQTHLFQIWIMPNEKSVTPRYGQKSFKEAFLKKNFILVVSGDGREGSIMIHQDADLYIGRLKSAEDIKFTPRPDRHLWVQVIKGQIKVNDQTINAGDGLAVAEEKSLSISALKEAEFMLFDLI
jgi:redox-sensitive bicupin YhaK (pirin superfamily)